MTRFPYELARRATDIAGGLLGTMPSAQDLADPVVGPYIKKYLAAVQGVDTVDRMKVLRLIENMVAGAGAVAYLIESMHGAGSPMAQRIMIARQSNLTPNATTPGTYVPGIEDISPSHPAEAIGCVMCHGGDPLALDANRAHAGMNGGRNPGDLSVAQQACGQPQCHAGFSDPTRNHIERVDRSLQATYASAIAKVRFTFGAQPDDRARLGIAAVSDTSR